MEEEKEGRKEDVQNHRNEKKQRCSGFSGTESCTSFKLTRIWGIGQCGKESKRKTVGT